MNWDYIAGFFDGEGTIYFRVAKTKRKGFGYDITPNFRISQKDKNILEEIQKFMAFGYVGGTRCHNGFTNEIQWSQRAHALNVQGAQNLEYLCDILSDRVITKKKQIDYLKEYLILKKPYRFASVPKQVMLQFLDIAQKTSLSSVKPSRKYQEKITKIRQEIMDSTWIPKTKSQTAKEAALIYWKQVAEGTLPRPTKVRYAKPDEYVDEKVEIAFQHPEKLIEILMQARKDISKKRCTKLRKRLGLKGKIEIKNH